MGDEKTREFSHPIKCLASQLSWAQAKTEGVIIIIIILLSCEDDMWCAPSSSSSSVVRISSRPTTCVVGLQKSHPWQRRDFTNEPRCNILTLNPSSGYPTFWFWQMPIFFRTTLFSVTYVLSKLKRKIVKIGRDCQSMEGFSKYEG